MRKRLRKKHSVIINILLLLFLVSALALCARIVYLNVNADKNATVVAPGNLIGRDNAETSASSENVTAAPVRLTVIELYQGQPVDSERFEVANMLPGDTETRGFAVKITHNANVSVLFNARVTSQTKSLADVLQIKITNQESGKVVYEGAFADMKTTGYGESFSTLEKTETVAYYTIEVSLPTSVGNEYQGASLTANFEWRVQGVEVLDVPQTNKEYLWIWIVIGVSMVIMVAWLILRNRDKED